MTNSPPRRRHQIHFWLSASDYQFVRDLAEAEDETVTALLRRLIKVMRAKHEGTTGALRMPTSPRFDDTIQ